MLVLRPSLQCELVWGPGEGGSVPKGAVKGGHTIQGEDLYICRLIEMSWKGGIDLNWRVDFHPVQFVLFLIHTFWWSTYPHSTRHMFAICHWNLIFLRATMDGNRLIGKVNPRHRVCYLPHNGLEVIVADHVAKNHDIMLVIMMQPCHSLKYFVQAPVSSYSALTLRPSKPPITPSPVSSRENNKKQ